MKLLAIIPVRMGSKRIPGKNMVDFNGRPLLDYTVKAAIKSNVFTRIIVSTEAHSVKSFIETNYSDNISVHDRPGHLATDTASVMEVANAVLDSLRESCDYVFIMLPSTPMRTHEDILKVSKMLGKSDCNAVVSVSEYFFPLIYALEYKSDGRSLKRSYPEDGKKKSQETPIQFVDNGGIYALSPADIRKNNYFPAGTLPYFMPKWASIDIDTEEDLLIASAIHKMCNE